MLVTRPRRNRKAKVLTNAGHPRNRHKRIAVEYLTTWTIDAPNCWGYKAAKRVEESIIPRSPNVDCRFSIHWPSDATKTVHSVIGASARQYPQREHRCLSVHVDPDCRIIPFLPDISRAKELSPSFSPPELSVSAQIGSSDPRESISPSRNKSISPSPNQAYLPPITVPWPGNRTTAWAAAASPLGRVMLRTPASLSTRHVRGTPVAETSHQAWAALTSSRPGRSARLAARRSSRTRKSTRRHYARS